MIKSLLFNGLNFVPPIYLLLTVFFSNFIVENTILYVVISYFVFAVYFLYKNIFFEKKNVTEIDIIDLDASVYSLVKHSPIISFITDTNGKLIVGNQRGIKFYKSGIDKIQDSEIAYFKIDDIKLELNKLDNKLLQLEKSIESKLEFMTNDGEKYLYKISKIPIRANNGKIEVIVNFICNIDAHERIVKERETYISTLTHDIKTPVIAQIRALELLLDERFGAITKEQREMFTIMLDSCNYTYEMLKSILMNYREFNELHPIHYTMLDINELIETCVRSVKSKSSKKISFNIFSNNNHIMVKADRNELENVIISFLLRSLHSAYENSNIEIELIENESYFELKISCLGPYIEQEKINKTFKKISTDKEKFNIIGFGLGLFSLKKIIEAHGGKIFVKSYPDNRNIAGFTLPLLGESKPEGKILAKI